MNISHHILIRLIYDYSVALAGAESFNTNYELVVIKCDDEGSVLDS